MSAPFLSADSRPVVGMLHCPPLPGAPRYAGDFESTRLFVLRDAETLADGGVPALMLENFGDAPFFPDRVPAETIAALSVLAADVRRRFDLPLGINVLRNDGPEPPLAIAAATGAEFIRVNVLCGARLTDQGIVQGIAHDLLRDRERLKASRVRILADVDVKHSAPLASRPLAEEVRDLIERGGADAVIVTGTATGRPADEHVLRTVKQVAGAALVFLGSGVSAETAARYSALADGFIVGTSLKADGNVAAPIDAARVRALMASLGTSPS